MSYLSLPLLFSRAEFQEIQRLQTCPLKELFTHLPLHLQRLLLLFDRERFLVAQVSQLWARLDFGKRADPNKLARALVSLCAKFGQISLTERQKEALKMKELAELEIVIMVQLDYKLCTNLFGEQETLTLSQTQDMVVSPVILE